MKFIKLETLEATIESLEQTRALYGCMAIDAPTEEIRRFYGCKAVRLEEEICELLSKREQIARDEVISRSQTLRKMINRGLPSIGYVNEELAIIATVAGQLAVEYYAGGYCEALEMLAELEQSVMEV